mmetsp:Transcript_14399/g.35972  ORF Transcript_14399/g.35972 Transcript_14399/m.35972 type:complete len:208 (+) Transcript_14399:1307-1930(+)
MQPKGRRATTVSRRSRVRLAMRCLLRRLASPETTQTSTTIFRSPCGTRMSSCVSMAPPFPDSAVQDSALPTRTLTQYLSPAPCVVLLCPGPVKMFTECTCTKRSNAGNLSHPIRSRSRLIAIRCRQSIRARIVIATQKRKAYRNTCAGMTILPSTGSSSCSCKPNDDVCGPHDTHDHEVLGDAEDVAFPACSSTSRWTGSGTADVCG